MPFLIFIIELATLCSIHFLTNLYPTRVQNSKWQEFFFHYCIPSVFQKVCGIVVFQNICGIKRIFTWFLWLINGHSSHILQYLVWKSLQWFSIMGQLWSMKFKCVFFLNELIILSEYLLACTRQIDYFMAEIQVNPNKIWKWQNVKEDGRLYQLSMVALVVCRENTL